MLEKTEGPINDVQSIDTGNIGDTRNRTKTNKTRNTDYWAPETLWDY
jgi:hypothetical protein